MEVAIFVVQARLNLLLVQFIVFSVMAVRIRLTGAEPCARCVLPEATLLLAHRLAHYAPLVAIHHQWVGQPVHHVLLDGFHHLMVQRDASHVLPVDTHLFMHTLVPYVLLAPIRHQSKQLLLRLA